MATIKQKLAVKKIIENRGNVSKSMVEVGYKKNTAHNPRNLLDSKGFQALLEKHLPESLLLKVHKEGLAATKQQGVGGMVLNVEKKEFGHTEIAVPDYAVRHKYLETGYKIRGKLNNDNSDGKTTNNLIIIGGDQAARIARRTIARVSGSEESPDRLLDSNESGL